MTRSRRVHYVNRMRRITRDKIVQIKVTAAELEALHEIALAGDETMSQMLRRLAREERARREGTAKPEA